MNAQMEKEMQAILASTEFFEVQYLEHYIGQEHSPSETIRKALEVYQGYLDKRLRTLEMFGALAPA